MQFWSPLGKSSFIKNSWHTVGMQSLIARSIIQMRHSLQAAYQAHQNIAQNYPSSIYAAAEIPPMAPCNVITQTVLTPYKLLQPQPGDTATTHIHIEADLIPHVLDYCDLLNYYIFVRCKILAQLLSCRKGQFFSSRKNVFYRCIHVSRKELKFKPFDYRHIYAHQYVKNPAALFRYAHWGCPCS